MADASPVEATIARASIIHIWVSGRGTEAGARILTQFLSKQLGTPVVVEQKLGASGTIAMAHLARAKADGYTLSMGTTTTLTSAPFLHKNPGYDAADVPSLDEQGFNDLISDQFCGVLADKDRRTWGGLIQRLKIEPQ